MKRAIAATIIGVLLGGVGLIAGGQGRSKKHNNAKQTARDDDRDGSRVAVQVVWSSHDVDVVRRYYTPKYRHLPPGLQKKYARTGQLPPGWRKKMEPFPAHLERDLPPLPAGYHRGVFDAHAVIYNSRGLIIDVAVLF